MSATAAASWHTNCRPQSLETRSSHRRGILSGSRLLPGHESGPASLASYAYFPNASRSGPTTRHPCRTEINRDIPPVIHRNDASVTTIQCRVNRCPHCCRQILT